MKQSKKEAAIDFMKRYGYIIVLSIIMIVISTILILSANNQTQSDNNTPVVNNEPVSFYSPLLSYTVAKDYNDKSLVYNNTLKQWEAHKGICFTAAALK